MRESRAKDKAWFCLSTGVQPSEYDQMTVTEVEAFVAVQKKMNKQR